jgi:hypothetical protein
MFLEILFMKNETFIPRNNEMFTANKLFLSFSLTGNILHLFVVITITLCPF